MTTGRRWFALPILLAALVGCGKGDTRPASRFISIATGGSGGVYYPYGGGLAKILNDKLPDVRATAEVTAASVDNLKLIRDERADIAFTLADTLADAVAGRGPFDGRAVPAVSLAVLYSNYTHIVTLASSNIRQVSDLRGRTVSTGSPGSGTEVTAVRLLSAAGIDPDREVRRQGLGASESCRRAQGREDRCLLLERRPAYRGGPGSVAHAGDHDATGAERRSAPGAPSGATAISISRLQIPAGTYPGVAAPVPVVGVANVLVVNRAMPDDLAYDITRLLFEHQPELAAIHPEARNLSLTTAAKGSPAPFHPGALRWYREKGSPPQ